MVSKLAKVGEMAPFRFVRPSFRRVLGFIRKQRKAQDLRKLEARWNETVKESRSVREPSTSSKISIGVINLPHRTDRLAQVSSEMQRLGVEDYQLIEGVLGRDLYPDIPGDFSGAIGCNLAHSRAVKELNTTDAHAILVCEDDVEFLVGWSEINELIEEFLASEQLDVLCLAGRVRGSKMDIGGGLYLATGIVGQACYVVKPHMVDILSDVWTSGVQDLAKLRLRGKNDIAWNQLQTTSALFAFPQKKIAQQRPSYSDIQGRMMPTQEST